MLLEDQPYPIGMDKAKILFLAQRRALKEESEREESSGGLPAEGRGVVPEGTKLTQASDVPGKQISLKRVRMEVLEGSRRKFQQGEASAQKGESEVLKLRNEEERMGVDPGLGGSVMQKGPLSSSVAGEGVQKHTLLRFQVGSGWLGKGLGAITPVAALGAFELGLDQEKLDVKKDEEVISGVKDALGVV